jgi:hypothetical protein
MTAFQIGLRATIAAASAEDMAQSVTHVGQQLNEICVNTPNLMTFTLESDRPARTVRFTLYVEETDPERAVAAAFSWAVTAINATGDGAYGWQMAVRPEQRERIPA